MQECLHWNRAEDGADVGRCVACFHSDVWVKAVSREVWREWVWRENRSVYTALFNCPYLFFLVLKPRFHGLAQDPGNSFSDWIMGKWRSTWGSSQLSITSEGFQSLIHMDSECQSWGNKRLWPAFCPLPCSRDYETPALIKVTSQKLCLLFFCDCGKIPQVLLSGGLLNLSSFCLEQLPFFKKVSVLVENSRHGCCYQSYKWGVGDVYSSQPFISILWNPMNI